MPIIWFTGLFYFITVDIFAKNEAYNDASPLNLFMNWLFC